MYKTHVFDRISFVISISASVAYDYVGDSKASELHLIPSTTAKKEDNFGFSENISSYTALHAHE